ncbi:MAG: ammonium transporter [Pirellulaceae bacterium]
MAASASAQDAPPADNQDAPPSTTPTGDQATPAMPELRQEAAEDPQGTIEDRVAAAQLAGDNAWMLTSCALVLFMTAPGLALFYSGLVRKKNVLGVMMQCIFLMGLMTVIWALIGFSLAFGGEKAWTGDLAGVNAWIGDHEYALMNNVSRYWSPEEQRVVTPPEGEEGAEPGALPRLTFMLFQGMFFIITPALICGAFAERMKFSTMVVFSILWGLLVYCPLCHWVWDGGILAFVSDSAIEKKEGYGILGGALDFAGGTVVHISSGVSALICALLIGRRLGYGSEPMPPHNLTYTAIGAAMLWFGWFGFNAGSALLSDGLTSSAFATTHFSAAAGALSWPITEWIVRRKPTVLGACSGAVAGLVCITPAAGFVDPMAALAMGAIAGVGCYLACTTLKMNLGYDDSLDAFGVHGVGGTLGALLTGVFATRAVADISINGGAPLGLVDGVTRVMIGQVVATAITIVFAGLATLVLLKVLDVTMGLRVTQEQELQGLDLSQHGEEGYIFI